MHDQISIVEADPKRMAVAMEFYLNDGRVHGFAIGHMLTYLFEANPETEEDPDAPEDRVTFWFSTHTVIVLGWRLPGILPLLREGRIAALCANISLHGPPPGNKPFISEIAVEVAEREVATET